MKNKSTPTILIALFPIVLSLLFFVVFVISDGNWAWLMLLLFVAPITSLICGIITILLSILALMRNASKGRSLMTLCLGVLLLIPAVAYTLRFII